MDNQNFEKLNLVYGQIYELSIMIGQLIDRKQLNGLDNFLDVKEGLYDEAEVILKELGENADLSDFVEICDKIREQESMNINLLTSMRDDVQKEINNANKKSKLINAYSNVETKQGNLLDFRE